MIHDLLFCTVGAFALLALQFAWKRFLHWRSWKLMQEDQKLRAGQTDVR